MALTAGLLASCSAPVKKAVQPPPIEPPEEEVDPTAWVPPGFETKSAYPGVAFRWRQPSEYTCDIADCIQVEVVTPQGCDTLYAEVALTDAAGSNIGFTNDLASGVQPQQVALMEFRPHIDHKSGYLSKISCT